MLPGDSTFFPPSVFYSHDSSPTREKRKRGIGLNFPLVVHCIYPRFLWVWTTSFSLVILSDMADILRYVGTILIAFQIVGRIGYAQTIIALPLALPIRPLLDKLTEKHDKTRKLKDMMKRTGLAILFVLSVSTFVAATLALLPITLAYLLVGRPLLWLNSALNLLLLRSMEPWKEIYFAGVRTLLRSLHLRTRTKPADRKLWKVAQQNEVPFLALFGIVCVTLGFVLQQID